MQVVFINKTKDSPPGKIADVELHFEQNPTGNVRPASQGPRHDSALASGTGLSRHRQSCSPASS